MTTTLLKYMLRGMLKGIEEYESMLEKEHVDPKGKMAEMIKPPEEGKKDPFENIDLDKILDGV